MFRLFVYDLTFPSLFFYDIKDALKFAVNFDRWVLFNSDNIAIMCSDIDTFDY